MHLCVIQPYSTQLFTSLSELDKWRQRMWTLLVLVFSRLVSDSRTGSIQFRMLAEVLMRRACAHVRNSTLVKSWWSSTSKSVTEVTQVWVDSSEIWIWTFSFSVIRQVDLQPIPATATATTTTTTVVVGHLLLQRSSLLQQWVTEQWVISDVILKVNSQSN